MGDPRRGRDPGTGALPGWRRRGRQVARALAAIVPLVTAAASAQVTVIDFDDRPAPSCPFSGAERLGDQWSALGVTFSAAPGAQTGAIQDVAACSWMVSGHSPPNIAAHVAGLADLPLHVDFDPPVESVGILATNWRGIDTITLTALDGAGGVIGSDSISTLGMVGPLQLLEVVGAGIVRAEITNTSVNDDVAFDDLRFVRAATQACCFADGACEDLDPLDCAARGGVAEGTSTDCASATCPPPPLPGWTPDGAGRSGEPLRVRKAAGSTLELAWGLGCSPDVVDFTVHEGAIGDWPGHAAALCDTAGALTSATLAPAAGDRYLLVVPVTATEEGSYGLDSFGAERPRSTGATCVDAQALGCP